MSLSSFSEVESFNLNRFAKTDLAKEPVVYSSVTNDKNLLNGLQRIHIDEQLANSLSFLSKSQDVNLTSLFTVAFHILLQRYASQENIHLEQAYLEDWNIVNIGADLNLNNLKIGKIAHELNSINTLPDVLKNHELKLSGKRDFKNLYFENPKDILTGAQISDEAFQIFFISQHYREGSASKTFLKIDKVLSQITALYPNYHFGLFFKEYADKTEVSVFYNKHLFSDEFFARFQKHFITLLEAIAKDPAKSIGAYNILVTEEWDNIIRNFNNTVLPYPKEKTLHHIFEEQAAKTPDQVALIRGGKEMSYSALNKAANGLAHYLIKKGVVPEDNIGLLATRDFEMIIGMLAILKAGGAYVPIDPDYPVERQEYIFKQSMLKIVVADNDYPLRSVIGEGSFIKIDQDALANQQTGNPGLKINSGQLAYTIYTSGSTGSPKGVMIEHHSAVNLILWVNDRFNISLDDRLLFITSMCFDLSVYDIFGMLAAGGTIVMAEKSEIQDVKTLQDMLVQYKITFWDSVPTTLDYLVRTLELDNQTYCYDGLKTIFLSGDWIPVNLPDRIKAFFPNAQFVSLGGATEGTVWSNFFIVEQTLASWNSIPYGRPITNNFFYILNEHLQPVPMGTVGELYIGGVGVARGYAGDAEKTNFSFIPDPFHNTAGGMMYRTGDLGRMMPDHHMEFIGRKDNQVKINGFRVELGEIESALNSSELILNAVVLAKNDKDGHKRLIAYVVSNDKRFDREAVQTFLTSKLPDYMVPAIWMELESLPLTSNGKVDRNSLPYPENFLSSNKTAIQPSKPQVRETLTETENKLLQIWKECMGLTELDINGNFFELGGHSLVAVQILSRFRKVAGQEFQLSILFKYPTIKALAKFADTVQQEYNYKYLVPIKPAGSKNPLYIVHGDGLNVLNFNLLASAIDKEQPVFGLQAIGLDGKEEPSDNLVEIARCYMREIIQHNPEGPYILAGYSSGGYVAMEIRKQMVDLGRDVQMLIILDTDAEKTEYKDWFSLLPKKARRHFPKFIQSYVTQSIQNMLKGKSPQLLTKRGGETDSKDFYSLIKKIKRKHLVAFRNYKLEPFEGKIYLYKAMISVHYVDYGKFLGWERYARRGVELFNVPGDHFSMLLPPYVSDFATILQKNLDECGCSTKKSL